MKKLLSAIVIILFFNVTQAQKPKPRAGWSEIEQLESKGLTKSALKLVNEIYTQAKEDNNSTDLIKSMLFKSKYALVLEENAKLNIINDFKTEIETSTFPTKNILENLLANLYWQYFKRHRWKFYNRTKTAEKVDTIDFRTWDLQTLFNEIHNHYQKSLEGSRKLQQENLDNYNDILQLAEDSKLYRPTLFDFLNHEALDFYKTNETHITKPAYKFEINKPDFLCSAEIFSNIKIDSKDSTSLQLNALKIYQNLIQFHLKDKDPTALTDVNIERLNFIHNHSTFNEKQTILLETLKNESESLKPHKTSGLYDFEIASIYYKHSKKYIVNKDETNRWKAKEAIAICNNVINKFPKSKAAEKCKVLKGLIEQQSLQIKTEEFLPIQTHGRLLVTYKNIENLNFQIFRINRSQLEALNSTYNKEYQLALIKKLKVYKTWGSNLKNEGDYQEHSTEVLVPKLDNGSYVIFASTKNKDSFAFSTIQITNIALVETELNKHTVFQFINRNNGEPIKNTRVELSYQKSSNRVFETQQYTTNAFGEIKIKKQKNYLRNITIKVINKNDTAHFGNNYISSLYQTNKEKTSYKAFIFTDRSIYRPGQIVYFKAITMKTLNKKSEILANEDVYATLYDVNDDEISELELTTNEFGSVSGEFIIPTTGLNGEYYIEFDSDGDIDLYTEYYFSVEEYKRPKFGTKFNPVTETFKVNESVTVNGNALAYAGSNITDAKVVYRVHRKVQYPRWYYWYKPSFSSEPQEITHGETTTNEKGEFKISFTAIPDQSVDKSSLPIFNYEITADVTDINGETRSATTIVKVGYHTLEAHLNISHALDKTKAEHKITIDTKNLNGEFVPTTGNIKIYKLKAPNRVLRPRPWDAPDYQEFSQDEFKKLFPHDAYTNEDNPKYWEKGYLVLSKNFDTKNSNTLELGDINDWVSGQYIIILESQDNYGQTVKDEIRTILYSDKDKTVADKQLFNITTDKDSYKINDKAKITLASAAKDLNVTIKVVKANKTIDTKIITLNNNKKTFSIPIEDTDEGGFVVYFSFAAFNSYHNNSKYISVPYRSSDLEIETISFRDKLEPGTDETWTFKVKGAQGEKESTELLASMYDLSLDQFKTHLWNFKPINKSFYFSSNRSSSNQSFGTRNFRSHIDNNYYNYPQQQYDQLNWFGLAFGYNNHSIQMRGVSSLESAPSIEIVEDEASLEEVVVTGYANVKKSESTGYQDIIDSEESAEELPNFDKIQIRKNLNETAFFFPHLLTDEDGNVSFSFTTPEALTQWKLQLLAHTKTLESATKTLTAVTQKELMVIPNTPRFLRHGDQITISTKISNLTDQELKGQAALILTDAITRKDITANLLNPPPSGVPIAIGTEGASFTVSAKGNTQVSWNLSIPDNVDAVQYKIIAKSGDFSDGEQNALPVLSNRKFVTETMPMWVNSNETRTFKLDKLKNNTSTTLKNHKLTLEMTSNPAWYAIQALPYLMEYPYECNEQTFSRYYANALASHIVNSNPRIQEVFNLWKSQDALMSNLEKNEELKSILIQETPWLRDAQTESEQKKRIALLFDLNKMTNAFKSALRKLENNQLSSGAWPWFNGGRESRYITQHIITGFGHLKKLNVIQSDSNESHKIIQKAIKYLDAQFIKEYKNIKKYNAKADLSKDHLSYTQLHYLYMRSFFPEIKKSKEVEDIMGYYQTQINKYWLSRSLYAKGLMALISHRNNDVKTTSKILNSLKENSITSDELGMYWKANTNSWHWYQAPIETQALLIETFSEAGTVIQSPSASSGQAIAKNLEDIDNLKKWLLKNKQTNRWKTTKATTEAVYALLLQGSNWLSVSEQVDVLVGGKPIPNSKLKDIKVEAGTGYFKTDWNTTEIKPEMAEVTIRKKEKGMAWGALYWQYFEDLDKISSAKTPLILRKKLFLKTNTDLGEEITEITDKTNLKVGDLIRVRIELRSDRNMEFVHMKDMRASGLEPINVISKYKWQDGLGYYESTKDASTNFFFDYLPKGVYVFEYDLRVNNAGDMSNGITNIQSMYAPEFSSHSEGVRIKINQ